MFKRALISSTAAAADNLTKVGRPTSVLFLRHAYLKSPSEMRSTSCFIANQLHCCLVSTKLFFCIFKPEIKCAMQFFPCMSNGQHRQSSWQCLPTPRPPSITTYGTLQGLISNRTVPTYQEPISVSIYVARSSSNLNCHANQNNEDSAPINLSTREST